jgi:hypothetical protein
MKQSGSGSCYRDLPIAVSVERLTTAFRFLGLHKVALLDAKTGIFPQCPDVLRVVVFSHKSFGE